MIRNSKSNNFFIEFPKGFFYKKIEDKYDFYLKRLPNPYEDLRSFMNASIQGTTFPSFDMDIVTQTLYEDHPVKWKDGFNFEKHIDKTFTITFKTYEGYINYWIMLEQLHEFYKYDAKNSFFPDITLSMLDVQGLEIISIQYKKVLFTNLSSLELSYSSTVPNFNTFDATFHYNYLDIKRRLD